MWMDQGRSIAILSSPKETIAVYHVLYEMLFNIADNAVRYTEQNGHKMVIFIIRNQVSNTD